MSNLEHESDRQRFSDIRCALFDLDGTLINTIDLICRSFDHAVQNVLGQKLSRRELLKNIGRASLNRDGDAFLEYWEIDVTTRKAKDRYSDVIDGRKRDSSHSGEHYEYGHACK